MRMLQINRFNTANNKVLKTLILSGLAFVLLTLMQDFLRANFNQSAFYFSEALMFSSFWWIFVPFIYVQCFLIQQKNADGISFKILLVLTPFLMHLFLFPVVVWALSGLFYYHTYSIYSTFKYTLSAHLYTLLFLYSVPVLVSRSLIRKSIFKRNDNPPLSNFSHADFETTLTLSEGNKYIHISVSDIFYITANTPYIDINLCNKRYLHNETLKTMMSKLNNEQFLRIHKSVIVNIQQVQFYTSRLNGDYDLTMFDGIKLRLSRNYATRFKEQFGKSHQLTKE